MAQRSILITGCSSGIGEAAAHALAARGWRVFATCRQEADCARLRAAGLESFPLDYTSTASITAAVQEALQRTGGTLDAVYNNGAYAIPGAVEDLPTDALRAIFETNVFGYHEVIRQVLPVMRRQGHGRIINCSSVLGFAPLKFRGAYQATKFALEGLTDTLRLEIGTGPIKVCLIEPGPIGTLIREKSRPHFYKWIKVEGSAFETLYREKLIPRLESTDGKKDRFELGCDAVVAKLIHALEHPDPRPRYFVTFPTWFMAIAKRLTTSRQFDRLCRKFS